MFSVVKEYREMVTDRFIDCDDVDEFNSESEAIKTATTLNQTEAEAIYTECFGMADYLEWAKADVEEDAMNAFTTGQVDYLLEYMQDIVDEMSDPSQPDMFELTISAIEEVKAFMN